MKTIVGLLFVIVAFIPTRLFAADQPVTTSTSSDSQVKCIESVKVAQLDFVVPKEKDPNEPRSLEYFFNLNKSRQHFAGDAGTEWSEKWDLFSNALIRKAVTVKLDAKSLKRCIEALSRVKHSSDYQGEKQKLAVIPTEAYLAKHEKGSCWVIVCQWEEIDENAPYTIPSHIRVWAVDAQSYDVIAFMTCI